MLRVDRSVTPTMAKAPTLAQWELDRLRTIEHVVRLGHVRGRRTRTAAADGGRGHDREGRGRRPLRGAGLQYRPLVPIWGPEEITVQPIRSGFPCFGAALAGFVEGTVESDEEKNRLCPPSPYPDTPTDWARMQVLGGRAAMAFSSHTGIKAWADSVSLNPARTPPEMAGSAGLRDATERFRKHVGPGMSRLAELAGMLPDP